MSNTLYTVTCDSRSPEHFSTKENAADYAFEHRWCNPKIEEKSFKFYHEYLAARYGEGLNEIQQGKVYSLAYEHAGYEEVSLYYQEYADFAREILVAESGN